MVPRAYQRPPGAAGEAKPNTEVFRLLAVRLGLEDPCFSETDEQLAAAILEGSPGGVSLEELRSRGFAKVDVGQAAAPHAEGGSRRPTASCPSRPTGWPAPASIRCPRTTSRPRRRARAPASGTRLR
jgi:hypothetical protein